MFVLLKEHVTQCNSVNNVHQKLCLHTQLHAGQIYFSVHMMF